MASNSVVKKLIDISVTADDIISNAAPMRSNAQGYYANGKEGPPAVYDLNVLNTIHKQIQSARDQLVQQRKKSPTTMSNKPILTERNNFIVVSKNGKPVDSKSFSSPTEKKHAIIFMSAKYGIKTKLTKMAAGVQINRKIIQDVMLMMEGMSNKKYDQVLTFDQGQKINSMLATIQKNVQAINAIMIAATK